MAEAIDRTGETFVNREGCVGKIVKYKNAREVYVLFENCIEPIKTTYAQCKNGEVKNPYHLSVANKGYLGQGIYKVSEKGKLTEHYRHWNNMMQRCYNTTIQEKYQTYEKCEVCEEWHNFQNFARWYEDNSYKIEGEQMCLDKDILAKGNKVYSPETCVLVPQTINKLFIKSEKTRGKYPLGVVYHKPSKKYTPSCSIKGKGKIYLGIYDTVLQAFEVYKEFKEQYIKEVAEEYKDKIPQKLYEAMYSYKIEITD